MVFHTQYFTVVAGSAAWEKAWALLAGLGWAGVDLFFVLSGFLITGILYESRAEPNYYRVFYLRRTVRIAPLYYIVLFAFFFVLPLTLRIGHIAPSPGVFGTTITQVFAWVYATNWMLAVRGFGFVSPCVAHFWSLAVEEQFYLGWPAVVRGISRRRLLMVCGVMAVCAALVRIGLFNAGWSTAAYVITFARMDGLAIGAIVALAARDRSDWATLRRWAPAVTLLAIAGLVDLIAQTGTTSFGDMGVGTFGITLLCIIFGGVLVLAVDAPSASVTKRTLEWSGLRWFGKHSYCLYIVNQPVMWALAKVGVTALTLQSVLPRRVVAIGAMNLLGVGVCALLAFASWHLFEKHWLALKSRPLLNHAAPEMPAVPRAA